MQPVIAEASTPFVGRTRELEQLHDAWRQASAGRGRMVIVQGEPGVGKTTLVERFVERLDDGAAAVWSRCYVFGGTPAFWAFQELVSGVRSRLPADRATLAFEEGAVALDPDKRFALFRDVESMLRTAARSRPLLWLIDDLHACDMASLELLAFLARRLPGSEIMVLATNRSVARGTSAEAELNASLEINNRTFVFRLTGRDGNDVLLVFGCGNVATIDAVRSLREQTNLSVGWVVGNGGSHHLFLDLWYQAFPDARILVPERMMFPKGVFRSALEGQPGPIADPAAHWDAWQQVLAWDIAAWTSAHDPPTVCGPKMSGAELEAAIRASLARSGEDDPTGARLKWNRRRKKA